MRYDILIWMIWMNHKGFKETAVIYLNNEWKVPWIWWERQLQFMIYSSFVLVITVLLLLVLCAVQHNLHTIWEFPNFTGLEKISKQITSRFCYIKYFRKTLATLLHVYAICDKVATRTVTLNSPLLVVVVLTPFWGPSNICYLWTCNLLEA